MKTTHRENPEFKSEDQISIQLKNNFYTEIGAYFLNLSIHHLK